MTSLPLSLPSSTHAQPRAAYKAGQPGSQQPSWAPPGASSRDTSAPFLLLPNGTMRPLWLCWALWVLPPAGPGVALTGEQILGSLLQQLHLREVPTLDKANVEELDTPGHARAQYVSLLQRGHGARSRGKRFSQNFRGEASSLAAAWSLQGEAARGPGATRVGGTSASEVAERGPWSGLCLHQGPYISGSGGGGPLGPAAQVEASEKRRVERMMQPGSASVLGGSQGFWDSLTLSNWF